MNTMMMTRMMAEDCGVPELRGYSSNGSEIQLKALKYQLKG